jgi:microsomal prostaglandin-E synthase 2
MLSSLPATSFSDGGKRDDEKWARKGPFMAAGAISFSFAASSFTTAVAKERPSSEFIPKDLVLYQYEACPFCNKVKAFLDYHDLPYKIVEVNPLGKKEIKWSDYKKVPILMVDGKQLNDSSAIIDKLDSQIHPNKGRLPTDAEEEEKWRRWVDEHLVHILSPNIYRSASEALESFDYITTHGNFSTLERLTGKYVGAAAMYFVSKKLKKKHNITDERASLYEAANAWVEALNNRLFMGGSKPNLADLAVFGVLRPIRYLQSGRDMVANTNIGAWYSRMEDAVGGTSGIKD